MNVEWLEHLRRREQRRHLAEAVAHAPHLAHVVLSSWSPHLRPAQLEQLISGLEVPDTPDVRSLVHWVFGDPPAPPPLPLPSEAEYDRWMLERVEPRSSVEPHHRLSAGLYLIARLAEELKRREYVAWADARWEASPKDGEAHRIWASLLSDRPSFEAGQRFRKLWGEDVRRAFSGLGLVLRLPPGLIAQHVGQALEALELIALGPHLEIAARILETAGEPIDALSGVLEGEGWSRISRCTSRRDTWSDVGTLLEAAGLPPGSGLSLQAGADLAVLVRLISALRAGKIASHALGLPGWGLVKANRARMRGRLRAVVGDTTSLLRQRLLELEGLYARTSAAVARYAWGWAWREARTGFGFDAGALKAAACTLIEPSGLALRSLGPEEEGMILTFLLLVCGRGRWIDLERWLAGVPAATLSKSYYRCLAQVPDLLADPMEPNQRVRRYARLWEHLADGGLEDYLPALRAVRERLKGLKPGRELKAQLHSALLPEWDVAAIALPDHHLPGFLRALQDFGSPEPRPQAEEI